MLTLGVIRNESGERLDYALHLPPGSTAIPDRMAVIGHGVTSNKDRPWLVAAAEALADAGVAALRVSFAGNGDSEGRFEDATLSKEVDDLGSVIDALVGLGITRLAYVGHSMGGAIGVLRASRDARLCCLVSLAGMVHVHDFMQRHFGHLEFGRGLMLDKPGCVWNRALAEDAARIGSLGEQARTVTVPWLLVHGDADELVPFQDSVEACRSAGGRAEIAALGGVDHRFTGAESAMARAAAAWVSACIG